VRADLLGALGGFRDPSLVDRALGLLLSGTFDLRETGPILLGLSSERATRARTYEWVKASYDELTPKLPQQFAAYLPLVGSGFCDAARRDDIDAFFRPRSANLPGGEILLGRALERVEACAALTAAQRPAVAAFLASY
jgi:alanyl aminopeptidase